jgi:hypothetical protein
MQISELHSTTNKALQLNLFYFQKGSDLWNNMQSLVNVVQVRGCQ